MEEKKILLVEDEVDILNLLKFNFQNEGFAIYTAQDGDQALELAKKHLPHLIVLDLMLPGKDGLEVAKILKKKSETKEIPIIMLTAKGEEEDRVSGFELGADDYVVKPFSPRELLLRVWAVLKRTKNLAPKEDTWEKEGLRIEFETYRVLINTQEIDL
ncbi:MAG TPA: response regulator, partial [Desulfohalobiaceae bacterium]|nr:response regulator [Desulfohalobiaceae bacterium]